MGEKTQAVPDIPRHLVWSTDRPDLSDPFQRKWLLRQTLTHGRAEDIAKLDVAEIEACLEELDLPLEVYDLWRRYFASRHAHG